MLGDWSILCTYQEGYLNFSSLHCLSENSKRVLTDLGAKCSLGLVLEKNSWMWFVEAEEFVLSLKSKYTTIWN